MKRIVFCCTLAIISCLSSYSPGQEVVRGLLGGQEGSANKGTPSTNQSGGLTQGTIRDQIRNAIQPNLPGVQNTPSNSQLNGQVGGPAIQSGAQFGANSQQITNNQQGSGASIGSQLLGVLRANLGDHTAVGQDGTVRFRNDVNPQLRGIGILPNDQLIDSNGQGIRDLKTANSILQSNQNVRVMRNGQIVTLQQSTSQTYPNSNQFGWSFGTRNNGVFISSLVSDGIAAKAGLRAGDQIVSINGHSVTRTEDISTYMPLTNNSTVSMMYLRNGQSGEASFNSLDQGDSPTLSPQSIQSKLDQIERLIGEIRAELSSAR